MREAPIPSLDVPSLSVRARAQLASFPTFSRSAALRIAAAEVRNGLRHTGSPIDAVRFSWPQSILALALEFHPSTENTLSIREYVTRWERRGSPLHHLDMAMVGHACIFLQAHGGLERFDASIERITHFLKTEQRDPYGSLVYRKGPNPLVLVDTLGIICPLLTRLAKETGNREFLDQALLQFENFWSKGFQASTGLPYHGYSPEGTKCGIVGWSRGVGWAALGLAQTIIFSGHDPMAKEILAPKLEALLRAVQPYQNKNGSFAWQLQATEGPTDSSGTGMITYAAAAGIDHGWIHRDEFSNLVTNGMRALAEIEIEGVVLGASGECLGVGCYPQTFGEYPWGTAPALLLASVAVVDRWAKNEHFHE